MRLRTFLKWSPSLTKGTDWNIRFGFMDNSPWFNAYKSDVTKKRSEVDFTGRKRERGTLTPCPPLKCFIAAPTAVSN